MAGKNGGDKVGVKISVVIATKNCEGVIEQAICSFISQNYENKELIIIDGGSTDRTLSIINRYKTSIASLVSEKDDGIYDAYNKGIRIATGDYIVFIGADDAFYNRNTLRRVAKLAADRRFPDLLCTQILYIEKGWVYIEKKTILYGWEEGLHRNQPMIPHQGLYAKKSILLEHPFCTDYEICSDLDFYAYCCKQNKHIEYADIVTAHFSRQGISSGNWEKRQEEENRILEAFGEKIADARKMGNLRRKIRQCISEYRMGVILLTRFCKFRIHKCRNDHCRWCDHNRRRIKGSGTENEF